MNATKITQDSKLTASEATENFFLIQLGKDVGSAIAAAYAVEKENEYGLEMAKLVWAIISPILAAFWTGLLAAKEAFQNAREREAFYTFYLKVVRIVGLEPPLVSENLLGSSKTTTPTLAPQRARESKKVGT